MNNEPHSFPFVEADIVNGQIVPKKTTMMTQSDIVKCPHFIIMPDHYRADDSCKCNDETQTEMSEWGYVWDGKRWA